MVRLALGLAVLPAVAFANADRSAPTEPSAAPAREDRIEGPFATVEAYCAMRGGACEDASIDDLPAAPIGQAIRAYRFVSRESTIHVVVQTSDGWFGRAVGAAGTGDSVRVDLPTFADVARGPDAELMFDVSTNHAPCGCSDLYHRVTSTFACTVDAGALRCTDAIENGESMHLADIWSYESTLVMKKRGRALRVSRTITESEGLRRSQLRRLAEPFTVSFHR